MARLVGSLALVAVSACGRRLPDGRLACALLQAARMRYGRACCVVIVGAALIAMEGRASAGETWTLDPSGDWIATAAPEPPAPSSTHDDAPGGGRPRPDAPPDANGEAAFARRSPAALAGGIVLTSVSALVATVAALPAVAGFSGYDAGGLDREERATAIAVFALGLAGTAGGITLIAWGAQKEPRPTTLTVGPSRVAVAGTF